MPLSDYTRIFRPFQLAAAAGLALAVSITSFAAVAETAPPRPSAVVFAYQRVGEDSMPHTSISTEQFLTHMAELERGGYSVLSLDDIMQALKTGASLPDRTVAITFDGAYASTHSRAMQWLDDKKYPYAVFYSSEAVDRQDPGSLTWGQLRDLRKKKNVTLGILPAYYTHMAGADMATNTAAINKAIGRYREEFDAEPAYFSWPYGEYSQALKNKIAEYGFAGVFGMQSGVAHAQSDFNALPRFTMNDIAGGIDRFRQTADALPLPVSDLSPEDPVLHENPPMIGFTVAPDIGGLDRIACFVASEGKVAVKRVAGTRVELRPEKPFNDRRTRVNCTLPAATKAGEEPRWRWLGMVFIDPEYSADPPLSDATGFE